MKSNAAGYTEGNQRIGFLARLKRKWNVRRNVDFVLILAVFALTGFSVVEFRHIIYEIFGFSDQTSAGIKTATWLIVVFPVYQVLLLAYGWLLGQFSFFWEKEKRLIQWLTGRKHRQ